MLKPINEIKNIENHHQDFIKFFKNNKTITGSMKISRQQGASNIREKYGTNNEKCIIPKLSMKFSEK